jgi:hypothetical protein
VALVVPGASIKPAKLYHRRICAPEGMAPAGAATIRCTGRTLTIVIPAVTQRPASFRVQGYASGRITTIFAVLRLQNTVQLECTLVPPDFHLLSVHATLVQTTGARRRDAFRVVNAPSSQIHQQQLSPLRVIPPLVPIARRIRSFVNLAQPHWAANPRPGPYRHLAAATHPAIVADM